MATKRIFSAQARFLPLRMFDALRKAVAAEICVRSCLRQLLYRDVSWEEMITSLYSSVAERQSCKLKVLGSIPSGGFPGEIEAADLTSQEIRKFAL